MSFESVKVNLLSGAISTCSKNINFSSSQECISQLFRNTVWECSAKNNLLKELNNLVNKNYELTRTLSKCQSVAGLIAQYKEYEQQKIKNLNEIKELNKQLYYEEPYTTVFVNEEGKEINTVNYRTVMNYSIKNRIDNLQNEVNKCDSEMIRIESEVSQVTY